MKSIPFTQYLRPFGEPRPVSFEAPDELLGLAQQVIDRGYRFECEELTTGHVSLTVHDPSTGEDVGIQVVPNGPEVTGAVEALVREAAGGAS